MDSFEVDARTVGNESGSASLMSLLSTSNSSMFDVGFNWHRLWYSIACFLSIWITTAILWKFWWKAPSNVIIAAYPTPLGRFLTALHMVVDSDTIVQKAYDSANGKPFAIPMFHRWVVFVSDRDQLKKLEREPEAVLSMEYALHELAFTESIMGHLQVPLGKKGSKSDSLRVTHSESMRCGIRVLKNNLRSNMPALNSSLQMRIKEAIALEMNNKDDGEWQKVKLTPALLKIFTRVNLSVFVGENEADKLEVYTVVMNFFWSCATAFPILMLMPHFLVPIMGPVLMGWGVTRQKVYNLLLRLTREALGEENPSEQKPVNEKEKRNVTWWTLEITKLQDAFEIAKMNLGLLFASAFQVPVIAQFCIDRYCKSPEYQEKLRAEALENKGVPFGALNQEMPYLDSFIKEAARLSPGIIITAPRAVMKPYSSPDGYRVPAGNWIAIPQVSLMRDEKIWPGGVGFQGFRFVDEETGTSKSRLTHPSFEFPFWGSIQHACPARFYVSVVMKMILSHLIADYEFKLVSPTATPFFNFSYTRLPNPFVAILVRKRPVGTT